MDFPSKMKTARILKEHHWIRMEARLDQPFVVRSHQPDGPGELHKKSVMAVALSCCCLLTASMQSLLVLSSPVCPSRSASMSGHVQVGADCSNFPFQQVHSNSLPLKSSSWRLKFYAAIMAKSYWWISPPPWIWLQSFKKIIIQSSAFWTNMQIDSNSDWRTEFK